MIIINDVDCGNAPKMDIVRQLNIALVRGDAEAAKAWLSSDVVWEMIGNKTLGGWEAVREQLQEASSQPIASLEFKHVMSHGKMASSNGTLTARDGQMFAFCHVYDFTGHSKLAKINHISSYIIALD